MLKNTFNAALFSLGIIATAHSEVQPLVSGQKVQVKRLTKDITKVKLSIVSSGPSAFQNPDNVKSLQNRFKQFTEALNRYPQLDDPLVQAARSEYMELQKVLKSEYQRAQEQLKQLGDVQARMSQLLQNFIKYPVPKPMEPPFSSEAVTQWVKQASAARTVAEHNLEELNSMAPFAYLPKNPGTPQNGALFDVDDLKRMQQQAIKMQKDVQNNYQIMSNNTTNQLQQKLDEINNRWQEDPKGDKNWVFLKADQVSQAKQLFAESKALAHSSISLEQALKRDHSLASQALTTIKKAEQTFQVNAKLALNTSRLPNPVSTDRDMTKYAKAVLDKPRYEFGQYGPVVLTTKAIIDQESKSSEIDIDNVDIAGNGDIKLTGTETTWTYRWQEFKFATPIQDPDGTWYIWWITAKKYSSGSSITPIGEWIAGQSTQGNPILPSNF